MLTVAESVQDCSHLAAFLACSQDDWERVESACVIKRTETAVFHDRHAVHSDGELRTACPRPESGHGRLEHPTVYISAVSAPLPGQVRSPGLAHHTILIRHSIAAVFAPRPGHLRHASRGMLAEACSMACSLA
jgi:hypothetical protein